MEKKRVTYSEKLEVINALASHVKSLDDVVKASLCGVSSCYKWIAQRAQIEQHVNDGWGDKVRVVVQKYKLKTNLQVLPSKYTARNPRKPTEDVRRVLEWLAACPTGSISLKELLRQCEAIPGFPQKTLQAQVAFVRRMVRTHNMHDHVAFKMKRYDASTTPPAHQHAVDRTPPNRDVNISGKFPTSYLPDELDHNVDLVSANLPHPKPCASPPSFALFRDLSPIPHLPALPTMPDFPPWHVDTEDNSFAELSGPESEERIIRQLFAEYDANSTSEPDEEPNEAHIDALFYDPDESKPSPVVFNQRRGQSADANEKSWISISTSDSDNAVDTNEEAVPCNGVEPQVEMASADELTAEELGARFNFVDSNLYRGDLRARQSNRNLADVKRCPPNPLCECWMFNNRFRQAQCDSNDCTNVANYRACPSHCKSGDLCANQAFDTTSEAPHSLFRTVDKGIGLKTSVPLKAGQHVIEYVGEVIGKNEFIDRFQRMAMSNAPCYYFFQLAPALYLDALQYGNNSRFINHSCEPNCIAEVWTVDGSKRAVITAISAIEANVEITFNYKWATQVKTKSFPCKCGSAKCCSRV